MPRSALGRACRLPAALLVLALAVAHPRAPRAQGPPEATHVTPVLQPPLATLDDSTFWELRDLFNATGDRTRLLVVLSPT